MKLPYVKFWFGDYLANTMHLSTVEHGAYVLLLFAYYGNGGPLQDDDVQLANIARLSTAEWENVRPRLVKFFTVENGYWKQRRADSEIAELHSQSAAKTESGRKAAAARWASKPNANAMRTQCDRNASHSHSQKKVKDTSEDSSVQTPTGAPSAQTAIADQLASICNRHGLDYDGLAFVHRQGYTAEEIDFAILQIKASGKTPGHWPSYIRKMCEKNRLEPQTAPGVPKTTTSTAQLPTVKMSEADKRKLAELREGAGAK